MDLYIKPADGSGEEKLLLKTDEPKSWSVGPRTAASCCSPARTEDGRGHLGLAVSRGGQAGSLLQTQFYRKPREGLARRALAGLYLHRIGCLSEIYVRPFTPDAPAGTGAKWLVSKGGGIRPLWRPDGKELFYFSLARQVMAVDIDASKGFQAGTPRQCSPLRRPGLAAGWDLSPDGKRFLFAAPPNAGRTIPFTVVLNWAAGLKK